MHCYFSDLAQFTASGMPPAGSVPLSYPGSTIVLPSTAQVSRAMTDP